MKNSLFSDLTPTIVAAGLLLGLAGSAMANACDDANTKRNNAQAAYEKVSDKCQSKHTDNADGQGNPGYVRDISTSASKDCWEKRDEWQSRLLFAADICNRSSK